MRAGVKSIALKCMFMTLISFFLLQTSTLAAENSVGDLINTILVDVIDHTLEKAGEIARESRGKSAPAEKHDDTTVNTTVNTTASDTKGTAGDENHQLANLNDQHNRKTRLLNQELDKELNKYGKEFRKEAGKEKKKKHVRKKQARLKEKVEKAYAIYHDKLKKENEGYQKKRHEILSRTHSADNSSLENDDKDHSKKHKHKDKDKHKKKKKKKK